jgi:hypothetical protein
MRSRIRVVHPAVLRAPLAWMQVTILLCLFAVAIPSQSKSRASQSSPPNSSGPRATMNHAFAGYRGLGGKSYAAPEIISFCDVPTILPRDIKLPNYSPALCFAYGGLGQEQYTLKAFLLKPGTSPFPHASNQWNGDKSDPPAVFIIDNRNGANASGTIVVARNMDVFDYPNFLWVIDLYNQADTKIASASQPANSTTDLPPILNPIVNKVGSVCQPLEFVVSASDPNNDVVNLSAQNLPSGATFDGATGRFQWQCPAKGIYPSVLFKATQAGAILLSDAELVTIYIPGPPEEAGQWGAVQSWPVVPIHMHLLPTGKVMFWDRHDDGAGGIGGDDTPRLWDPTTGISSTLSMPDYDLFCSGHSFLADGRLLITGGHKQDFVGENKAIIYDPFTNIWTPIPDMNAGRWYPSNVTLANGDILTLAGTTVKDTVNPLPQVWQAAGQTWRDLTTAQQGGFPGWADYYPFLYQAPNGNVFDAGPQQAARYLDTSGTGKWTHVATSTVSYRDYGSSVMYDEGKVLIVGGNPRDADPDIPMNSPSASAELIDLNAPAPAWRQVAPMSVGRRHLNTTLLPDGKVLVTGGSSVPGLDNPTGAVLYPELWDPKTEQWTVMAGYTRYRGYHSTALLLPDGRILMGGGGHPNPAGGTEQKNVEIYSPPYLFNGARPTITYAPKQVTYGRPFLIQTPDAASITNVNWIRLSSVTHAFNQNQRINHLSFSQASGGLSITAPSVANLSPPGYYMLFILNSKGVPSVASIVAVGDSLPAYLPLIRR